MFKIISDTACDLLLEYTRKIDVTLVPLYVTFDGEHYFKEQAEVEQEEFYRRMIEENAYPKSSLPSVQDYMDAFKPFAEQNMPVICICISTVLSGSYNSACMAKNQLLEDYPNAKITVFNSLQNSSSQGLFVHEAVRMRDDGVSYEDAIEVLGKMTELGRIFFTIESLDYLKKGGRIGKLATLISGALSIRPIIVLKSGELNIGGICRTRKKAKKIIIDVCKKHFEDNHLNTADYDFNVESGCQFEERDEFRKEIETALQMECVESRQEFLTRIGVVTACHTGPYALGVGIMPKYETLLKQ